MSANLTNTEKAALEWYLTEQLAQQIANDIRDNKLASEVQLSPDGYKTAIRNAILHADPSARNDFLARIEKDHQAYLDTQSTIGLSQFLRPTSDKYEAALEWYLTEQLAQQIAADVQHNRPSEALAKPDAWKEQLRAQILSGDSSEERLNNIQSLHREYLLEQYTLGINDRAFPPRG